MRGVGQGCGAPPSRLVASTNWFPAIPGRARAGWRAAQEQPSAPPLPPLRLHALHGQLHDGWRRRPELGRCWVPPASAVAVRAALSRSPPPPRTNPAACCTTGPPRAPRRRRRRRPHPPQQTSDPPRLPPPAPTPRTAQPKGPLHLRRPQRRATSPAHLHRPVRPPAAPASSASASSWAHPHRPPQHPRRALAGRDRTRAARWLAAARQRGGRAAQGQTLGRGWSVSPQGSWRWRPWGAKGGRESGWRSGGGGNRKPGSCGEGKAEAEGAGTGNGRALDIPIDQLQAVQAEGHHCADAAARMRGGDRSHDERQAHGARRREQPGTRCGAPGGRQANALAALRSENSIKPKRVRVNCMFCSTGAAHGRVTADDFPIVACAHRMRVVASHADQQDGATGLEHRHQLLARDLHDAPAARRLSSEKPIR